MRETGPISPCLIVAVLGIDGSGKSTLSRRLAEETSGAHRVAFIGDRAEIHEQGRITDLHDQLTEHLRRRIAARAKEAASLERYKIPKIAELLLRDRLLGEILNDYRPAQVFMDGMPSLNLAAWTMLYKPDAGTDVCAKVMSTLTQRGTVPGHDDPVYGEFPELARLRELNFDHLHVPDAVVFLDVPPEVCVSRIASRGRKKQVHETTIHLSRLRDAYATVCDVLEKAWNLPVLVLAGDRESSAVVEEARRFLVHAGKIRNGE